VPQGDEELARGQFLSEKQRSEWQELLRLSELHYERHIASTQIFVDMYRNNAAHWVQKDLERHEWQYDQATANLTYASVKNTMPRVLIQHPKVFVKPRAFATGRADRISGADPRVRWSHALSIQQYENWRIKEFNFKGQVERVQLDDHLRGMGAIRHGFAAPEDVAYDQRDKRIEFSHHQHIRPGWPFAVYWSLDEVRFDSLARSEEEMQWVGFLDQWRLEDLKKFPKVTVPKHLQPTVIAGLDIEDDIKRRTAAAGGHMTPLGRIPILEIWDRRTKRVIWWAPAIDQEIGVADWPLEWEGLPITMHASSPINEQIAPVSEQDILHELQQTLNKLLSMVIVYAKRGLPVIGAQKNSLFEGEAEKLIDAEILEIVFTKTEPSSALQRLDLAPVPQTLLMSIQQTREFIREISGQGRISSGTRENVESGTEAAGIIQGLEVRNEDRRRKIEDLFERMVRKDWQTFQQTVTEDIFLDVLNPDKSPAVLEISIEAIMDEYDLNIEVGSTAPDSDGTRKQDALQLAAMLQGPLAPFFNPSYIVQVIVAAFGLDVAEALAPQEAAQQKIAMDKFIELLTGQQSGGNATGGQQALPAALDSLKATPQASAGRNTLG